MKRNLFVLVPIFCLLLGCKGAAPKPEDSTSAADPETRIVRYLDAHAKPGEAIAVSNLYNDVFKAPEERKVLDRLFNSFFKIPISIVRFQDSAGRTPTLVELSNQFDFKVDGEMNVILKVMENDPRVPRFLERDSRTGEIVRVDAEAIRSHPQFGQVLERSVAGWEGKRAPRFSIQSFSGGSLSSADVSGGPYMIYFWFTHCPPCVKTAPMLVELQAKYAPRGFKIIGVNADRYLELPYTDADRAAYVRESRITFPLGHLTEEMQRSYGGVTLFPNFFFVNRDGIIVKHLMNLQEKTTLEAAIIAALGS